VITIASLTEAPIIENARYSLWQAKAQIWEQNGGVDKQDSFSKQVSQRAAKKKPKRSLRAAKLRKDEVTSLHAKKTTKKKEFLNKVALIS